MGRSTVIDLLRNPQDAVIAAVRNEDVAARVGANAMRLAQFDLIRGTAKPARAFLARAGQPHDLPSRGDILANDVVLGVCDQHVPLAIDVEVLGAIQLRLDGITAIAAETFLARAYD